MSKITVYSHYHPEALSMVGSPINQAVLLHVLCRYQEKIRVGQRSSTFSISANKIATEKNMTWRSVKQSLDLFAKRSIIEIDGANCFFNEEKYWQYLHRYKALPISERNHFTEMFSDPQIDSDEFEQFPLNDEEDETFSDIKGSDVMQNSRTFCEIAEPSAKTQNPMQKSRRLCEIAEPYAKKQNLLLNSITSMLESYAKTQNLLLFSRSTSIELSCQIAQNFTQKELEAFLSQYLDDDFDISETASAILHNPTEFTPEKLLLLAVMGSAILHKGLCEKAEVVMQNSRTDIIYNNKKENQSFALAKEREGFFEQEGDFEQDEPCVNFQDPLTTIELKGAEHSEELSVKDKQVYPFFSVQEVDDIVNNLQLAKTSSLRLFLYNLWGYASDLTHEGYDRVIDEDEQEILSEEEFFDPDGSIITKSDYRQLLLESYEQTDADIEKGCIELDEETVSLSIKEIFPRDMLFKILDWETAALSCQEMSVIISKSRIRNIEAETISVVHQPKTREERRQAAKDGRELMKRLYKAKQDNKLYSQLTSIEKIAADVIAQYFIPNPDKEDRAPFILKDGPIMVKEDWRALKVQISQAGLKESDFLSSLLNNKGPNDGDQLILQEPLFFWEGLKAVNETYQQTSILDSINIDE